MPSLVSRLSLAEATGLSLALICPSVTAAFNVSLVVQGAGPAAPLAFAIGTLAMVFIALSFMAFTRRVAHAGSAYAYISHTFGNRWGFVAGWTLLLTYLAFATGLSALVGSFTAAALHILSIDIGRWWIAWSAASMLLSGWLAYRDMRLAGRIMLALEIAVVLGIIALCIAILHARQPTLTETMTTVVPSAAYGGWTGMGFGMVFCIMSFAGFEGAAVLGEETLNPRRNIPIALMSTVVGSGVFFVFVAYCEVIGFGPDGGIQALAHSEAPLNDLALRFTSPQLAIALDLAAAGSCFCSVLGSLAAAARVLFALGRGGLAPSLGAVHVRHRTPARAVAVAAALIVAVFLLWAPFSGAGDYYSYTSTIGTLALILIYVGVGAAEIVEAWRERRFLWSTVCVFGPILMCWVLYRNLYPIPEFPNNLWPYATLLWLLASWGVIRARPAVIRAFE